MSAWNSLLESLHSALIDELNEQFSNQKPTLGMPLRQNGFSFPRDYESSVLQAQPQNSFQLVTGSILLEHTLGRVTLLGVKAQESKLTLIIEKIFQASLRRAEEEFKRRHILPQWNGALKKEAPIAEECKSIKMTIWIPMELGGWRLALGISR